MGWVRLDLGYLEFLECFDPSAKLRASRLSTGFLYEDFMDLHDFSVFGRGLGG